MDTTTTLPVTTPADDPAAEEAVPTGTPAMCGLILTPAVAAPGKLTATALAPDGNPVHAENLDPNDPAAVAAFLAAAGDRAAEEGLAFDLAAGRAEVLRAGLAMNSGAVPGGRPAGPDRHAVLAALRVRVVGETPCGRSVVFSDLTGKVSEFGGLGRLKKADLMRVAGPPARALLEKAAGERRPGVYTVAEAAEAVAEATSAAPRYEAGNVWGQGVWKDAGADALYVVNGDAVLRGTPDGTWEEYADHRVGGKALERDRSKAWAPDDLLDRVTTAAAADARNLLARLRALIGEWTWTRPGDGDALAGLVLAGYVPGTLSWRPLPEVVAKSGDGKSVLVDRLLSPLWRGPHGRAAWINPSSEAGLRQHLGNTALAYLCDEWDSWGRHQQAVQKFLRSGGRGGVTLRGTPGQKALSTRCDSLVVRVGVHGTRGAAQDENRRMVINMDTPAEHRLPDLPTAAELHALRDDLIAQAVRLARPADALVRRLNGVTAPGMHARVAESFSVPAAFLTVFEHGAGATKGQAEDRLLGLLAGRAGELDTVTTEDAILRTVLSSQIRLSGSLKDAPGDRRDSCPTEYPLGRLLGAEAGMKFWKGVAGMDVRIKEARRKLAGVGFRVFPARIKAGKPVVFVAGPVVCDTLLKGTGHEHADLNQVLRRLDGAEGSKQRLGPGLPAVNGVFVPLETFDIAVVEREDRATAEG